MQYFSVLALINEVLRPGGFAAGKVRGCGVSPDCTVNLSVEGRGVKAQIKVTVRADGSSHLGTRFVDSSLVAGVVVDALRLAIAQAFDDSVRIG